MAVRFADIARSVEPSTTLDAQLRLRALLRPARGELRAASREGRRPPLRRRIQAGPQNIWRYAEFLPLEGSPPSRATLRGLPAGCTPLVRADRLAERLGLRGGVGQERRRQPDALVQGPRGRGRGRPRPRAGVRDARLRLDRQPRERRRRPRGGGRDGRPTSSSRRPRGAEDPRDRRLRHAMVAVRGNYDDVNRLCTELSARAPVGVRQRQHAPVLRRGLQDARLRDRRAARAGRRPTASSRRSPPARCSPRSPAASRSGSSSAWSTATLPTMNGAQAAGCSPVATAFAGGHDVCRPVKPDTIAKSLAIGNPADGPYAVDLARRTGGAHRRGDRRRDPRRHPPARRDDRHLHRDGRRRDHGRAGQARRAGRHRPRRARGRSYITGEGLKTLDAVRGTFETHEIEPTLTRSRRAGGRRP